MIKKNLFKEKNTFQDREKDICHEKEFLEVRKNLHLFLS